MYVAAVEPHGKESLTNTEDVTSSEYTMHPCMNIRTYIHTYVLTQPHTQCSAYLPFVCLSPCFAAEPPSYLPATLPDTCDVTAQIQVWTVYTGVVCKGMG